MTAPQAAVGDVLAFPSVCLGDPGHPASVPGMTLRDWFAGQALTGFAGLGDGDGDVLMGAADTARAAYNYADAMLLARQS